MRLEFPAAGETEASRSDYWQEVVGDALCPVELRAGGQVPDRLVVGDFGPVSIGELTASRPGGAVRTRTHVSRSDADLCKIDVVVRGRAVIEQDGRQACLTPGDFAFVDLARPTRWANAPMVIVAVSFPRDSLGLHPDRLARLSAVRVAGHGGPGTLVATLAGQLPDHLEGGDARLGRAVLDLVTSTLATCLDRPEDVQPHTRRRALLLEVQAFIDQHLDDPRLTPRRVAAARYISVRYLHRLFEDEETTVAEWIRKRRLERCRRDLLDPTLRDEPVSAIAARWGLLSAAHFSRLFRGAYGMSPAEYRLSRS